MTIQEARDMCYSWHGGGGSRLYSFASTGKFHWNVTPKQCASEVRDNIHWCVKNPASEEAKDLPELRELLNFFNKFKGE